MISVAVLGEGAWGTAIASVLAHNGNAVRLWCHDSSVVESIKKTRINDRYMPQIILADAIQPTTSLHEAIGGAQWIFVSTPVSFVRTVVQQCMKSCVDTQRWIMLCKGIENDTGLLPVAIIHDVLTPDVCVAVLAGPSFATEVVTHKLTGVVVAAADQDLAHQAACLVANDYMRAVVSSDVIGVQCGGAFKNAMAVLIGIAQGSGWADNTRALLLTYGWQEIIQLATCLGARRETLMGLAGMGDLFLTLTGHHSKNFSVGCALGSGRLLVDIVRETGYMPEGANTIKTLKQLQQRHALTLPLFERLYAVVHQAQHPQILLPAIAPSVACAGL